MDNPWDVITNPEHWVEHEYQAQRGSKMQLKDYAKRMGLLHHVLQEPSLPESVKDALEYLLRDSTL